MNDYKGLYHKQRSEIQYFEHGAHFKYIDLFNTLKELQSKFYTKEVILNLEKNNSIGESPIKSDISLIYEKMEKFNNYKLKTKNFLTIGNIHSDNFRKKNKINTNETEKNKDNKKNKYNLNIEDSYKNILKNKRNNKDFKLIKLYSKSIAKKGDKLPKINYYNNNSISNRNKSYNPNKNIEKIKYDFEKEKEDKNNDNDNTTIQNESRTIKFYKLVKRRNNTNNEIERFIPKISSNKLKQIGFMNQLNDNKKLNEIFKKQIDFINNKIIQKNKTIETNSIRLHPLNINSHKNFNRISFNNNFNNKLNAVNSYEKNNSRYNYIIKSEKEINNNILLNNKNTLNNKKYMETINNDISQQIYHLKKNLINNKNKKSKIIKLK